MYSKGIKFDYSYNTVLYLCNSVLHNLIRDIPVTIKRSNLEITRQNGKTQVDAQRLNIIETAEKLFLEKGLEYTKMTDIAAKAGITRVTLYRYFPDVDSIAFEIAVRMLRKITGSAAVGENLLSTLALRTIALQMIDQFHELQDAFRYMGMFDHRFADQYPTEALATWYQSQVTALDWVKNVAQTDPTEISPGQAAMALNTTMSFLQKMAARGALLAPEQGVSVDEQLQAFREMINIYFDHMTNRTPM